MNVLVVGGAGYIGSHCVRQLARAGHRPIVLDNLGGGKFRVVDSNSNYDGIVRVRDPYVPSELLARAPGLVARVYRFTDVAAGPGTVTAASVTNATVAGSAVYVGVGFGDMGDVCSLDTTKVARVLNWTFDADGVYTAGAGYSFAIAGMPGAP